MVELLMVLVYAVFAAGPYLLRDLQEILPWAAAGAIALHAIHEQGWWLPPYQRFRRAVNRSLHSGAARWPLGPREALLLFLVELTVLPAAVLWGGILGALAAWSFMGIDRAYTHGERGVPGGWSALLAFLVLSALLWPLWSELLAVVVGFAALRLPWWRWRRRAE